MYSLHKHRFLTKHKAIKSIPYKSTDQPIRGARLRSDNGKEFTGEVITTLCSDNHIYHELAHIQLNKMDMQNAAMVLLQL